DLGQVRDRGRKTAIVGLHDEGQRLHGGRRRSEHRGDRQGGEDHGSGDLKEAAEQKSAMAKAKVPLLTATETAVKANAGSRSVSIVPDLKGGQAMADVTLLQGTAFKKVTEKLD